MGFRVKRGAHFTGLVLVSQMWQAGELAGSPRERYLLLDTRIVERTENARLAPGTVVKDAANPLFVADRPWEPRYDNMYPNVLWDAEEKIYKCWYCPFIVDERTSATAPEKRRPEETEYMTAQPNRREEAILYATSEDGVRWVKPQLGVVEFEGSSRNNIVARGPSGAGVFKDLREPDPSRRYKAFYAAQAGYLQLVRFSADGIRWGAEFPCPEIAIQSDCHANMIWSEILRKYIGIVRHYDRIPVVGNRKIARTESVDGMTWTKSTLALAGTPGKQAHDMVIFEDAGVFLGLLGVMNFPSMKSRDGVRQHIELAWSPDSIRWHRVAEGTPLVGNTPKEERKYGKMPYDWGALFPSAPVFRDGRIEIYYGASDWYFFDWRKSGLARAFLRKDGWAGYEPVDAGRVMEVRTHELSWGPGELRCCVDLQAGGALRVLVVDASGEQVGEGVVRGNPGELTDALVAWDEGLNPNDLRGRKVSLVFMARAAKLYSFSFESPY